MKQTFGRVTVDEQGIRKGRFLSFFGSAFDLTWEEIDGWDTVEAVLASPHSGHIISRWLELQTTGKVHFVDGTNGATEFRALVEEVRRRLPEKRNSSILKQMNPEMYR